MDTSPSNGVKSFSPYVKNFGQSPQNATMGDSHFYYLTQDCENDSTHIWPRILSESGIQSEPSFLEYLDVSLPEDWSYTSEFIKLRTTFNQNNTVMVDQMAMHYDVPMNIKNGSRDYFSYYIWLT